MRAWIHTEEHKRRTLQKSDVATAISKADMYDCTSLHDSHDVVELQVTD